MNCTRCWAKMLKSRRNSLFRMPWAALRKTRSPRSQVSTNPLRIEMTSLLFIYECYLLLLKGHFVYHSVRLAMPLRCKPLHPLERCQFGRAGKNYQQPRSDFGKRLAHVNRKGERDIRESENDSHRGGQPHR